MLHAYGGGWTPKQAILWHATRDNEFLKSSLCDSAIEIFVKYLSKRSFNIGIQGNVCRSDMTHLNPFIVEIVTPTDIIQNPG
jgi:hypothetical protein